MSRIHAAILIGEHPRVDAVVGAAKARGLVTSYLNNTNAQHWEMMSDPRAQDTWRAFRALDRQLADHLLGLADRIARSTTSRPSRSVTPPEILFFDDRAENVRGGAGGRLARRADPNRRTHRGADRGGA
ncbi:MAG: hypothetical protein U0527_10195 [Candidatus Eisenbacteria bacterium]